MRGGAARATAPAVLGDGLGRRRRRRLGHGLGRRGLRLVRDPRSRAHPRRSTGGSCPPRCARRRSRSWRAASRSAAVPLALVAPAPEQRHAQASPPVGWRASQSSSRTAAARESSPARSPPERCAIAVVKRSSKSSTGTGDGGVQARGERARLARLLGVGAGQRERQADHHAPDLAVARPARRARAKPRRVAGRSDGLDRRGQRARGIAQRTPAAGAAVIQGQHAHGS